MAIFNTISKYRVPPERQPGHWGTADEPLARELQARLDRTLNDLEVLGLQVSLRNAERHTWSGASGTTDLKRREPLRSDHVMRIASAAKLFTSVAALSLVESGRMRLEHTIDRWLPGFPRADRINIDMLLRHTSGIGHPPFTFAVKRRLLFSKTPFTLDELIELAAATPPYDDPGRSHQYSNANHHLLGAIAQKVSGASIVSLFEKSIFSKLGLTRTALLPDQPAPAALIPGWDNLYMPSFRPYPIRPDNKMLASHGSTSGGMVSTAEELRTFIDGIFDGVLLGKDIVEKMASMQPCDVPEFRHTGFGLGLFRLRIENVDYIGHLGLFVGFQAVVLHHRETGGSIAVVGNLSESRVFDVVARFADAI